MAHAPTFSAAHVPSSPAGSSAPQRAVLPDPGPALYMIAPVSFAITLGILVYLAMASF